MVNNMREFMGKSGKLYLLLFEQDFFITTNPCSNIADGYSLIIKSDTLLLYLGKVGGLHKFLYGKQIVYLEYYICNSYLFKEVV